MCACVQGFDVDASLPQGFSFKRCANVRIRELHTVHKMYTIKAESDFETASVQEKLNHIPA